MRVLAKGVKGSLIARKQGATLLRALASVILLGVNAAILGALLVFFIFRPAVMTAPWMVRQ